MAEICYRVNGHGCNGCEFFRFDDDKQRNCCFAREDARKDSKGNKALEEYFTALNLKDMKKAKMIITGGKI